MLSYFRNINIWYVVFIFALGLIFAFAVPPFQKPDEDLHFFRAAALARGGVYCQNGAFKLTEAETKLPEYYRTKTIAFNFGLKFPLGLYKGILAERQAPQVIQNVDYLCWLPFWGYIPNAIGYGVSLFLTHSVTLAFFAGRLSAFLIFFAILIWSIKNTPKPYSYGLYLYGAIPMLLHQVTAYSYDMLLLTFTPLLLSLFIRLIASQKRALTLAITTGALLIFATQTKLGYFGLAALVFAIPTKVFGTRRNLFLFHFGYWTSFLLAFYFGTGLVFGLGAESYKRYFEVLAPHASVVSPLITKLYHALYDPIFFLQVAWYSLYSSNYVPSFFGVFGWLDWRLNDYLQYLYLLALAGVMYLATISSRKITLTAWQKLVIVSSITLTLLTIYLGNYFLVHKVGEPILVGVQGRYFLPVVPLAFLLFWNGAGLWFKRRQKHILVFCGVFIFASVSYSMWERYYDYRYINNNTQTFDILRTEYGLAENQKSEFKKITEEVTYKVPSILQALTGFVVSYKVASPSAFNTLYQYRLSKSDCTTQIAKGYIDANKISSNGAYLETFGVKKKTQGEICVSIKPIYGLDNNNPLEVEEVNGKPIFLFTGQ